MPESKVMYWKGPGVLHVSRKKTIRIDDEIPAGTLSSARLKKFREAGKIVDHPTQVVISGDETLKRTVQDLRRQLNSVSKENTALKKDAERFPSLDDILELQLQAEKVKGLEAEIESIKEKAKGSKDKGLFETFFPKKKD